MTLPAPLIAAQQAADAAHAALRGLDGPAWDTQWTAWREKAVTVHLAVTAHAADTGQPRCEVEAAVKRAVRHPEPADARP